LEREAFAFGGSNTRKHCLNKGYHQSDANILWFCDDMTPLVLQIDKLGIGRKPAVTIKKGGNKIKGLTQ
jgi:hypothetical protein